MPGFNARAGPGNSPGAARRWATRARPGESNAGIVWVPVRTGSPAEVEAGHGQRVAARCEESLWHRYARRGAGLVAAANQHGCAARAGDQISACGVGSENRGDGKGCRRPSRTDGPTDGRRLAEQRFERHASKALRPADARTGGAFQENGKPSGRDRDSRTSASLEADSRSGAAEASASRVGLVNHREGTSGQFEGSRNIAG